jgi:hypothetical protein
VESTNSAHLEPLTPDTRRRIAHICDQVAEGLSTLADETVREIRADIPCYTRVPDRRAPPLRALTRPERRLR